MKGGYKHWPLPTDDLETDREEVEGAGGSTGGMKEARGTGGGEDTHALEQVHAGLEEKSHPSTSASPTQQQINTTGHGNVTISNPTNSVIHVYSSKEVDSGLPSIAARKRPNFPSVTPECSPERIVKLDDAPQTAADVCEVALKLHYKNTGSYVQMVPWAEKNRRHIMDIYTKLELASEECDKQKLVMYEDIFSIKTREGNLVKRAVLNGMAGRGKSTLFDKMAYDWACGSSNVLRNYKLLVLLKMHLLEQSSDLIEAIFDQLLDQEISIDKDSLKRYVSANQDQVLILLDGFDELGIISHKVSSFGSTCIFKVLNRKMLRECYVLVSTRPSHFDKLVTKELVQKPLSHIKVLGFSAKDVSDYIHKFFSDEDDKAKGHEKAEGLLARIQFSNVLSNLAESPMLLLLMCLLWRADSQLPKTMSRLYSEAVEYIFVRKDEIAEEEISKVTREIGRVGLHGLMSPGQVLSFRDNDFEDSTLKAAVRAGLLTQRRVLKGWKSQNSVQWIHKSFQEFCAGKYLQGLWETNVEKFDSVLCQIMTDGVEGFEYLLRFCCGDSERCATKILQVLQSSFQEDLSCDSSVGELALHCFFEGQSEGLPAKELIDSLITQNTDADDLNNDCLNSLVHFLTCVTNHTKSTGNAYLGGVQNFSISACDLVRFSVDLTNSMCNMTNLQCLKMSACRLSDDSRRQVVEIQDERSHGESETFDGSVRPWSVLLKQFGCLEKLILVDCSLTGQDMEYIVKSLDGCCSLLELSLSDNRTLSGSASVWSFHLRFLQQLQKLNLCNCSLTGEDMEHFADSLSQMPNLVELDLSYNKQFEGLMASQPNRSSQLRYIRKLNLRGCLLAGDGMKHVGESLSDTSLLEELDLSYNPHLMDSAALWSYHLSKLKCLQTLNLRGCSLTGCDMKCIADSLRDVPNLLYLYLSSNEPMGGSAASWAPPMKHLKPLQRLKIGYCSLTGEDLMHLAKALCHLPNFIEFNLSGNKGLRGSAALWAEKLQHFKCLEELFLHNCTITDDDKKHVMEVLNSLAKPVKFFD